MSAHRYWRINCLGDAVVSSCAELEMHETAGGANVCVGGTPLSSTTEEGFGAELAFDINSSTFWRSISSPIWLGYDFKKGVEIQEIQWTARPDYEFSESPIRMQLSYSDDGFKYIDRDYEVGYATWKHPGDSVTWVFKLAEATPYSRSVTVMR